MPRNIGVKAPVSDPELMESLLFDLTESLGSISEQEDTFFHISCGSLKLRSIHSHPTGELIFHQRTDYEGPVLREYSRSIVEDVPAMKETLSKALGVLCVVRKSRRMYITKGARIHLDQVEQLGWFVEIDIILEDEETTESGKDLANEMISKLGLNQEQLIPVAYLDLLMQRQKQKET